MFYLLSNSRANSLHGKKAYLDVIKIKTDNFCFIVRYMLALVVTNISFTQLAIRVGLEPNTDNLLDVLYQIESLSIKQNVKTLL